MKKEIKFNKAQEQRAALAYEIVRKKIENMNVVTPDPQKNGTFFARRAIDEAKKGNYIDATLYSVMSLCIALSYSPMADPEIHSVKLDMLNLGPLLSNPNVKLRWHELKAKRERRLNRAERRALAKMDCIGAGSPPRPRWRRGKWVRGGAIQDL